MKIKTKTMVEIWNELLTMFKSNDHELASRVGLSSGILGNWRSEKNAPKTIRASTLRMIEDRLSVRIEILPGDHWKITRDVAPPMEYSLLHEDVAKIVKDLVEEGKNGRIDLVREVRDFYLYLKTKEVPR